MRYIRVGEWTQTVRLAPVSPPNTWKKVEKNHVWWKSKTVAFYTQTEKSRILLALRPLFDDWNPTKTSSNTKNSFNLKFGWFSTILKYLVLGDFWPYFPIFDQFSAFFRRFFKKKNYQKPHLPHRSGIFFTFFRGLESKGDRIKFWADSGRGKVAP